MDCKNRIIEIISELSESGDEPLLISIDGMCASGKTTLGFFLKERFECNLFHMDDFFLQSHMRTPERLNEVGGNVDYERFKSEVIDPVFRKQSVIYRPYSCKEGKIAGETVIPYKRLNIIEGSYSGHPYFGDVYNLRIFTEIPEVLQRERIIKRNGEDRFLQFEKEWIPKETAYFEKYNIKDKSITLSAD